MAELDPALELLFRSREVHGQGGHEQGGDHREDEGPDDTFFAPASRHAPSQEKPAGATTPDVHARIHHGLGVRLCRSSTTDANPSAASGRG